MLKCAPDFLCRRPNCDHCLMMAVEKGLILLTEKQIAEMDMYGFAKRLEDFADEMRTWPSYEVHKTLYELRQLGDIGALAADTVTYLLKQRLSNLAERVLYALLNDTDGMRAFELARLLHEPVHRVQDALQELERRGYVEYPLYSTKTWHAIARP